MSGDVLLRTEHLAVDFGATRALDDVSLAFAAGEVHALVGENGAGKSTLLRIIAGTTTPTRGTLARHPDVTWSWAPQESELPLDRTVAEWVYMGRELHTPWRLLRRRAMHAGARSVLRQLGCPSDPAARLGSLTPPQRKQVQLARAIAAQPRLLLLDEPTAILGTAETEALFGAIRALRARGTGIGYLSHRIEEVLAIADRVTVLRDGRHVSTDPVAGVNTGLLLHRMVGRDLLPAKPRTTLPGTVVLETRGAVPGAAGAPALTVRRGEIVGLAGLVGAGRSTLIEAVARDHSRHAAAALRTSRVGLVPEDRGTKGLVPTLNLRENVCLPASGWWLRPAGERDDTRRWMRELRIKAADADVRIATLSGGNQQKVLLARALRRRPELLVLDEPTAGVDVGAKAEIHELVCHLADGGTGVLLASSDLPELMHLCDRIYAMRDGRIAGVIERADATEERLIALIADAARLAWT